MLTYRELMEKFFQSGLLPDDFDLEKVISKINGLKEVEITDPTEKRPVIYDAQNNILYNKYKTAEEAEKDGFFLDYYHAVVVQLMAYDYCQELEGIRYGFASGNANCLGVNAKENGDDLVTGTDIYEPLRDSIQRLHGKCTHGEEIMLCESPSLSDFYEIAGNLGLSQKEIDAIISSTNYLLKTAGSISPTQTNIVVDDLGDKFGGIVPTEAKVLA